MRRSNVGWLASIVFFAIVATWPSISFAQAQAPAAQAGAALKPEAIAGRYQGTATSPNGDVTVTLDLKADKGTLTGSIESSQGTLNITNSTIAGDRLTLGIDMGGAAGNLTGTVKGDRIEGTWTVADATGTFAVAKMAAADAPKPQSDKAPAAAPAAPEAAAKATAPAGDPLTGQWDGVTGNADMSVPFTMNLKLDGEKVTGDISSEQGGAQFNPGTWKDGALSISFEFGGMGTVTVLASFKEGKLVGTMDFAGQMQMSWAAVKK